MHEQLSLWLAMAALTAYEHIKMNKNLTSQINQEDWYLFIIFIMMAVAIIVKSYFHLNGYLTVDSTSYLKCAQNLLDGKGYYVPAYISDLDTNFFAIWPVGYPTFIFLIAKLTGLSVFWASKFSSIILIGIILGIFRALFNKGAYIYGLILLFSAYIEVFSYTWSETIFITTLVWFAASIYFFILSPIKITHLYLSIMMSSLLLFLSRYIGAFSFGLVGLLGLYYGAVMKDKSKSIILIGIFAINICVMVLYLYYNYTETGFPTGMKRMPSQETSLELLIMLIKALVGEILIPFLPSQSILNNSSVDAIVMFVIQFSILSSLLWKYRTNLLHINNDTNNQPITLSLVFGSIGIVYLIFIVLMRWIMMSSEFSFRTFSPGSLLIFIAIIYFLQQRATTQFFHAFKNFLIVFAILSYLLNTPYKAWRSYVKNPTYLQSIQALEKKYSDVEKDSIIIFGSGHLNYLYMDIQRKEPYSLPYNSAYKEKWPNFMTRIDPENKNNIYISAPKNELSADRFDQTVIDFVKKYDESTLVKLR